jgi:5,6-dimethylbenzimidazole synthase
MTLGSPPVFDAAFREQLTALLAWRRDVRRFRETPVPETLIDELLDLVQLSPSVGNSQPWRWVRVESPDKRAAIRANFCDCNARAQAAQPDEHAEAYAALKLEGMDRAPLQFAVFCDKETAQGHGLGQRTMPETAEYSTTNMIATFWLVARAVGLGVGWVSILDPERVSRDLDVPPAWKFIAYLCIGWPDEQHLDPELERFGWQARTEAGRQVKIV